MGLCITYVDLFARGCDLSFSQKYPRFADRIREGLVGIFGEKGR